MLQQVRHLNNFLYFLFLHLFNTNANYIVCLDLYQTNENLKDRQETLEEVYSR